MSCVVVGYRSRLLLNYLRLFIILSIRCGPLRPSTGRHPTSDMTYIAKMCHYVLILMIDEFQVLNLNATSLNELCPSFFLIIGYFGGS